MTRKEERSGLHAVSEKRAGPVVGNDGSLHGRYRSRDGADRGRDKRRIVGGDGVSSGNGNGNISACRSGVPDDGGSPGTEFGHGAGYGTGHFRVAGNGRGPADGSSRIPADGGGSTLAAVGRGDSASGNDGRPKRCGGGKRGQTPVIGMNRPQEEWARRSLAAFAATVRPDVEWTPFHRAYYRLLDAFAEGRIRRMMVSVPPQHGKSFGASVLLPAYLLGRDPRIRIAVASYSFSLAGRFGQQVQRLMSEGSYRTVFPATLIKGTGPRVQQERTARRTAQEFDCVGFGGGLKAVGRTGSLTGDRVDVLVADDLYKDALEAHSPLVRERIWEWYHAVARTRLHDASRELLIGTRWHEDDLIGRLKRTERVVELSEWGQTEGVPTGTWVAVSFEALKTGPPTELDPREEGEALWPGRHSAGWLAQRRSADPTLFEALFQGNPVVREGLLYGDFGTYAALPAGLLRRANYTDTADTGEDRLCSICYAAAEDGLCYVTDVVYTSRPMEETEAAVAAMLERNGTTLAQVESNNGGRGFGRAVERRLREAGVRGCTLRLFHQRGNKEARILTHAATVVRQVRMPEDWRVRWPEFAADVCGFRRVFRANAHDDGPDALTGIVETELAPRGGRILAGGFSKR